MMIRMLPLAVLLVACGPDDDGNKGFTTGGNQTTTVTTGSCVVLEERELAIDETTGSPMNTSAQIVLNEITGLPNNQNIFEWPDGLTIDVEIVFTYDDTAPIMYYERDVEGALPPRESERCLTAIELEGELSFTTGDGAFDESYPITLVADTRERGHYWIETDPANLTGSWTPEDSDLDATALGSYVLEFDGQIEPAGSEGFLRALKDDGTEEEVGLWAPPPTQG